MKRWYWNAVIAAALMGAGSAFADDPKKPAEQKADEKKADGDDKRTPIEKFRDAKKEHDEVYKEYVKLHQHFGDKKDDPDERKKLQALGRKLSTARQDMSKFTPFRWRQLSGLRTRKN